MNIFTIFLLLLFINKRLVLISWKSVILCSLCMGTCSPRSTAIHDDPNNEPLEISPLHLLYYDNGTDYLVPASQVKIGESLVVSEQGITAQVTTIQKVERAGIYVPLTVSGDIVVNGIVAPTYSVDEAFQKYISATTHRPNSVKPHKSVVLLTPYSSYRTSQL